VVTESKNSASLIYSFERVVGQFDIQYVEHPHDVTSVAGNNVAANHIGRFGLNGAHAHGRMNTCGSI
jgi:hypothetical protein